MPLYRKIKSQRPQVQGNDQFDSQQFMLLIHTLTVFWLLIAGLSAFSIWNGSEADTIFTNGDILTMKEDQPQYVEALAVGQGKILHAGSMIEALKYNTSRTKLYNLKGKTLLPGFVDPHSHISLLGYSVTLCNLFPIPDGNVRNFSDIVDKLTDWQRLNPQIVEEIGWVVGFGYDDSNLDEHAHPTKHELDLVSQTQPVMAIHASFHLAVFNSFALKLLNITDETPDPDGGSYRRYPNSTEPTGVLQENAFFDMAGALKLGAIKERMILDSQKKYAENGFTTVQDGRSDKEGIEALIRLSNHKKLDVDIYCYPDYKANRDNFDLWKAYISKGYKNRLRIAGAKMILDGSIQGKTGWLRHPYFHPPESQPANYSGYPSFPNTSQAFRDVQEMYDRKLQIIAHVNGDAAIDEYLAAVKAAKRKSVPIKKGGFSNLDNLRSVSIHSQMASQSHLDQMIDLKIIPSFFGSHAYYWGDWHRNQAIGPERAATISPAASAIKRKMLFTEHTDAPVTSPTPMRMLWAVVNRVTRSGQVLGPDERITPYQGLLSITRNAAIQAFQQRWKGTLEKLKLADLVILDSNPLKVPPSSISQVLVMETFKQGRSIYKRADFEELRLS